MIPQMDEEERMIMIAWFYGTSYMINNEENDNVSLKEIQEIFDAIEQDPVTKNEYVDVTTMIEDYSNNPQLYTISRKIIIAFFISLFSGQGKNEKDSLGKNFELLNKILIKNKLPELTENDKEVWQIIKDWIWVTTKFNRKEMRQFMRGKN